VQREKHGFMFPVAYWFREEWNQPLRQILLSSHFVREGLFQAEAVTQLVDEHRRNQADHHNRLWLLLNLAIWHQLYIEQQSQVAVSDLLTGVQFEQSGMQYER
jgi:asparagine synthase (glutamine-hydrolysing)